MSTFNQAGVENKLGRFFTEPTDYFERIIVGQTPNPPEKAILWHATTLIKARPPKGVSFKAASWGGTGTDYSLSMARIKSICEAMERWALKIHSLGDCGSYGFNIDPSSTGLAAYPENPIHARKQA